MRGLLIQFLLSLLNALILLQKFLRRPRRCRRLCLVSAVVAVSSGQVSIAGRGAGGAVRAAG